MGVRPQGGGAVKGSVLQYKRKPVSICVEDDRLAELWGFMLGDGYVRTDAVVILAKDYERPVLEPMLRLLGDVKVYEKPLGKWITQVYMLMVNSRNLAELLRSHFYPKRIPEWMVNKPMDYKIRVIRGLFEAEGSVQRVGSYRRIFFVNTNKSIVDFVVRVLRDLGVSFGYRESVTAHGRYKNRFDIWLHKAGVEVFKQKIGFLTPEKNARLLC